MQSTRRSCIYARRFQIYSLDSDYMLSISSDSAKSVTQIVSNTETRYDPALRHIWPWPELLLEKAADWILSLPGDTWLDAACGLGPLAKLIGNRKKLVGLDIDSNRLRRAAVNPFEGLTQASVNSLPFVDNSLDGIVSIETLEHVARSVFRAKRIREMHQAQRSSFE